MRTIHKCRRSENEVCALEHLQNYKTLQEPTCLIFSRTQTKIGTDIFYEDLSKVLINSIKNRRLILVINNNIMLVITISIVYKNK